MPPINYGSEGSDWEKLPKVGEAPKEFHIIKAERVDDPNYKFNFTKKEQVKDKNGEVIMANGKPVMADVNQGFRYVFTCEEGKKFSISSWKPFYAFKEADVQEGDRIRVSHPEEGTWKVEKISKPTQKTTAEVWNE
jgi:hypothetical protein